MYLRDIEREDLCVIFNYTENGLLKNRKGRRIAEKQWAFTAGAELIPYNADAIRMAADEKSYLVITEGEIDALSWMVARMPMIWQGWRFTGSLSTCMCSTQLVL